MDITAFIDILIITYLFNTSNDLSHYLPVTSAFQRIQIDQLLPGYKLQADYADSACNSVLGIGEFIY